MKDSYLVSNGVILRRPSKANAGIPYSCLQMKRTLLSRRPSPTDFLARSTWRPVMHALPHCRSAVTRV